MRVTFASLTSSLAAVALLVCGSAAQALQTLHIRVSILDTSQQAVPVAGHALLISDDPPSATPRRVLTGGSGSLDIKLRPGRYTIESEEPAVASGRAFEWTQMIEVSAGTDAVLVLDESNATTTSATGGAATGARGDLRTTLLGRWQETVVEVWTPTSHASGVLVHGTGLVATPARAVGNATVVAVQLSPTLKVEAPVLATTAEVSIALVSPERIAGARPVAFECGTAPAVPIADAAKLFTVSAPMRSAKAVSVGFAKRTSGVAVSTDFRLPFGGAGGPVFDDRGELVGLSALGETSPDNGRATVNVIGLEALCSARAAAEAARSERPASDETPLPVEPGLPLTAQNLDSARRQNPGWPQTLQTATTDFEISLLTPLLLYAERREYGAAGVSDRTRSGRVPVGGTARPAPQRDFANWREYVDELPPVLLVRVTPRQVEGFWATVARGAAMTQGIALPRITHFKPGLARMQLLCDGMPVTPIHPFVIEQPVSETEAIREGLFVFDPLSLKACQSITLTLTSEKVPAKAETKQLDRAAVQKLLEDIARP